MSWSPISLSAPISSAASLASNIGMFVVSPWDYGVNEGAGLHTYLSFPNAVSAVVKKIALFADPVLIIAITASNEADFAKQCGLLGGALPLKQLQSWQKKAASLAKLELEKFNLVDAVAGSNSLAMNALPTMQSVQKAAISQSAKASAGDVANGDPLANLTVFQANKSAFDEVVDSALSNATAGLTGGTGWAFYAESDIAAELQKGHPGSEYTLTAMMVLSAPAADLQVLREIII